MRDFSVVVVGSGISGLLVSQGLAGLGISVALVERAAAVATGATTSNEGWIHRGTYHAVSIADPEAALGVARRCIEGARRLEALVPEALEPMRGSPLAFTTRDASDIVDRWDQAGVAYTPIGPSSARARAPFIQWNDITAAYEVNDSAIDTAKMVQLLFDDVLRKGVEVFRKARLSRRAGKLSIVSGSEKLALRSRLLVLVAGAGIPEAAADLGLDSTGMRFWVSHLAHLQSFADFSLLSLDPNEMTSINHGSSAIVGLNDDVIRSDIPGARLDEGPAALLHAIRTRLNIEPVVNRFTACTKVDLVKQESADRVLAPTVVRLSSDVIAAVPGKMTEAPYLAATIVSGISSLLQRRDPQRTSGLVATTIDLERLPVCEPTVV